MNLILLQHAQLYFEDQRLASLENDLTKKLSKDGAAAINSLERLWKSKSKSFWDDVPEAIYGWLMVSLSLSEAFQLSEIKKRRAAIRNWIYPKHIVTSLPVRKRLRQLPAA